jgi:hypothetical protein
MASISLPTAAAVAGLAGAGISAAGAIEGGIAQEKSADYQAAVARSNANDASMATRPARRAEKGVKDQPGTTYRS